jgi:acetylornithine deacetylase/succinyl-diaminopimelate desuccinylase-like protein
MAAMDRMLESIAAREDDLVELTRDLIRFPTVNPPGEAYTPCAEFVGERLAKSGFAIEYVRGEGEPGDTDRYPRINVVARREGKRPGPACISIRISTLSRPATAGPSTRSRAWCATAASTAAAPAT